jgi:hypothetical protein
MSMAKHTHSWTSEKLSSLSKSDLKSLSANAERMKSLDLMELCNAELISRAPMKASAKSSSKNSMDEVVTGFHFVCTNNRGVVDNGDGSFWSGSWVVAENRVQECIEYEGYLALHENKNEGSYRQGRVVSYRRAPRDMIERDNEGIEFLVIEDGLHKDWVGSGSGEKGYLWSKRIAKISISDLDSE